MFPLAGRITWFALAFVSDVYIKAKMWIEEPLYVGVHKEQKFV